MAEIGVLDATETAQAEENENEEDRNSDEDEDDDDREQYDSATEELEEPHKDRDDDEEEEEEGPPPGKDPSILKWLAQSEDSPDSIETQMAVLGFEEVSSLPKGLLTDPKAEDSSDSKSTDLRVQPVTDQSADQTDTVGELPEGHEEQESLEDLSKINRQVRPFRNEESQQHENEHSRQKKLDKASTYTPSIACSSIAPEVARQRVRLQAKRKQQVQQARRVRKSGEAAAATDQRRENRDEIKQSLDAVWF